MQTALAALNEQKRQTDARIAEYRKLLASFQALIDAGVDAGRLAIVGYGEFQAAADNATAEGRNANRRVLLVILATPLGPDAIVAPHQPPAIAAPPTTGTAWIATDPQPNSGAG